MTTIPRITALVAVMSMALLAPANAQTTGRIIYERYFEDETNIFVLDTQGVRPFFDQVLSGVSDTNPAWSPDGSQVAFTSTRDGARSLYVASADKSQVRRLTVPPASDDPSATIYDDHSSWSPDGTTIAFQSNRDDGTGFGYDNIWAVPVDGSEEPRLVLSPEADLVDKRTPAWSPDGRWIAFTADSLPEHCYVTPTPEDCLDHQYGSMNREIWLTTPDGAEQHLIGNEEAEEENPAWSPDGTRIAYLSRLGPYPDIYVLDVTTGVKSQLTNTPDAMEGAPTWAPDGMSVAFPFRNDEERGAPNIYSVPAGSVMAGAEEFTNLTGGAAPDEYGYWPEDSSPDWGRSADAEPVKPVVELAQEPVEAVDIEKGSNEQKWGFEVVGILLGGSAILAGAIIYARERKRKQPA